MKELLTTSRKIDTYMLQNIKNKKKQRLIRYTFKKNVLKKNITFEYNPRRPIRKEQQDRKISSSNKKFKVPSPRNEESSLDSSLK